PRLLLGCGRAHELDSTAFCDQGARRAALAARILPFVERKAGWERLLRCPRDWARGGDTLETHGRRPKIAEAASGRNGRRHVPTKGERILMNLSRMGFTWWGIGPAIALFCAGLSPVAARATEPPKEPQGPLRIIVFGAHPDDCELEAG